MVGKHVNLACRLTLAVFVTGLIFVTQPVIAAPFIDLGPSDGLALDQPRVAVRVYDYNPDGTPNIIGPEYHNTFLLDTGSNGVMAVDGAVDEMVSKGYQTDGSYNEIGVGGSELMDVSKPYYLDFAGSNGVPVTLPEKVRLLSKSTLNFGSFDGIVGMPAMVNRITTLDMTVWSGEQTALMGVDFPQGLPGSNGHRYAVPLNLVNFKPTGQVGDDPLPTYAPLGFAPVEVQHAGKAVSGQYLIDTGAQMSIISLDTAIALGFDKNGNGLIDDGESLGSVPLGGIGGEVDAPVLEVDDFALRTEEGIDLVWTQAQVAVLDIPGIPGVLGMDLFTSGWLNTVMLGGEDGYIEQMNLDFRDADNMKGTMLLDINPSLDSPSNVIPEPATIALFLLGIFALFCYRKRSEKKGRISPHHTFASFSN